MDPARMGHSRPVPSLQWRDVKALGRGKDVGMTEMDRMEQRLGERFEALHQRMEAMERRADQRFAEIRVKQEEDIQLLKAMSCQLRGRVERVERRAGRGVT
jgi:arginine/ornithine N-succinyltransferase beta subunit